MDRIVSLSPDLLTEERRETASIADLFYLGEFSSEMHRAGHPFKIDGYVCCVCTAGACKGRINLIPYRLKALGISINIPGQLLEVEEMTPDFRGFYLFMSKAFVDSLGLPYNFQTYMSVQENPVLPLHERQYEALLSYRRMVRRVIDIDHPNRLEIIRHITCAFFYGIGYYFHQTAENKKLSNEETLMQEFLKVVQQFYKKERKVSFYAERLHLSSGYLSTVIRKTSGKTAAEWIDDYVTMEAKSLLKSTSLTVQQISDRLNFPSQSFFGKYFKRKTGMSPRAYRDQR